MMLARAVLGVLLLAAPLMAQMRESMTVEVIQVPVYVTDSAGKPIRNLQRDAFELRVDGKPHAIEYFDTVDVAAAPAVPRLRRERRLYLLLFDLAFSTESELAHAQKAAGELIESDKNPEDLFAVAKYTPLQGVQYVSAFLNGRAELRRALYTLSPSEAHDPLGVAINHEERVQWVAAGGEELQAATRSGLAALATAERASALRGGPANRATLGQGQVRLTEDQMTGLAEAVARLGSLEGQKHVIFFSEGARTAPSQIYLRALGKAFREAGVFLHAVGPVSGNRETLRLITEETGGKSFWGRDMSSALQELVASEEVAYQLGFRRGGSREGAIAVKVSGLPSGASVHYRTGFGASAAKKAGDPLVLADIVTNDVEQRGVDLEGLVKPGKGSAELAVRFPREQIAAVIDRSDPIVDLYLYIFNSDGGTMAFQSKRVRFDEAARRGSGKVGMRQSFGLPPGKYVAKVLLAIHGSSAMGFMHSDFEVGN
jgi:VWFA-related protein